MVSWKRFVAALSFCLVPGAASALTYSIVGIGPDRAAIVAEGAIEPNEGQRFREFLSSAASRGAVPQALMIHSPGGIASGAFDLGFTLRQLGFGVIVAAVRRDPSTGGAVLLPGRCASACVLAMMGGRRRVVPDASRIYVHRHRTLYASDNRDAIPQSMMAPGRQSAGFVDAMRSYASMMGVDPGLVTLSDSVPHESARLLTPSEVRRFRLSTESGGAPSPTRRARRRA
jgi:hypothetical protein